MTGPNSAAYHPTIRELPASERPRERLEHYGAQALSNGELLATAGIMDGYPDGKFRPNQTMTRGAFDTILSVARSAAK